MVSSPPQPLLEGRGEVQKRSALQTGNCPTHMSTHDSWRIRRAWKALSVGVISGLSFNTICSSPALPSGTWLVPGTHSMLNTMPAEMTRTWGGKRKSIYNLCGFPALRALPSLSSVWVFRSLPNMSPVKSQGHQEDGMGWGQGECANFVNCTLPSHARPWVVGW